MEQITVRNLTFSYTNSELFALNNISFSVPKGEIFLLIGESGCGKTTLLRHLKPAFVPVGKRNADCEILFDGRPMASLTDREQVSKIGYVSQNVEAMQVTDYVWHEIAFGLESLGYSQEKMQRRVAEMTAFFGLEHIYGKALSDLSGGQKQLVNLASVMAMEPELLILDESAAQLDPMARIRFYDMIRRIHKEFGTTIVLTEHRLEDVLYMCDRVMVMEQGEILLVDETKSAVHKLFKQRHIMYYAIPTNVRLYLELEEQKRQEYRSERESGKKEESLYNGIDDIPLTTGEGKVYIEKRGSQVIQQNGLVKNCSYGLQSAEKNKRDNKLKRNRSRIQAALETGELWFRYSKEGSDILKGCSISLCSGKITAVMGGNGTGKSTFLQVLAKHLHPYSGLVKRVDGQTGILPQNPQVMFTKRTVAEELEEALKRNPAALEAVQIGDDLLEQVIDEFELKAKLRQHPFDLSGGEMQRLGLAKLILEGNDIFLLDEPEKGMDFIAKQRMGHILKQLTMRGKTVLMVSHDVEFCARYADMCGLFFDGSIVSLSDTGEFFQNNIFYTTAIQRMCKNVLPEAVLLEDVVKRETLPEYIQEPNIKKSVQNKGSCKDIEDDVCEPKSSLENNNFRKNDYNKVLIFVIIFVVIPVTIYIGETVLQHRKYYFISLLLVLEAITAFFLEFEKRKPKLRQIMLVAMMTAITVAGRELFYMIPNIKPVAALVILSGVSFGGEAGFLIGSMSMLVSNIFFGQGSWTPWQMFAMGMLGFLAGHIFKQEGQISKKKKWGICIYGFLAVVLFYGVLMNLSSVIMYQDNINSAMILAALGAGLPFDLIHGCGTFVFLMIGATPLLSILNRVKAKYGFDF